MADDKILFGKGELNPFGEFFIGNSYLNMLTDSGLIVANVTFEPGCRNNWHIHHADNGGGQILLVTNGEGWYQEEDEKPRKLTVGSVVNIPAGVKHWHGASKNSEFTHIAIEVPGENASTEWLEPVGEDEYNNLE